MAVQPVDILELAKSLLPMQNEFGKEVAFRSATSRAYYSAFHAASLALPDDLQPSQAARRGKLSHQAVINSFTEWGRADRPGRVDAVWISRNLLRLKQFRKQADYNIDVDFSHARSQEACQLAEKLLERADRAFRAAARREAI
jgi:uncharacterized protein (UPF0332 family)